MRGTSQTGPRRHPSTRLFPSMLVFWEIIPIFVGPQRSRSTSSSCAPTIWSFGCPRARTLRLTKRAEQVDNSEVPAPDRPTVFAERLLTTKSDLPTGSGALCLISALQIFRSLGLIECRSATKGFWRASSVTFSKGEYCICT